MMERNELLRALRSTAADQHRCFGCGYEYKCSIRGCAINRAAAELSRELVPVPVGDRRLRQRLEIREIARGERISDAGT